MSKKEFAFDVVLTAVLRVKAESEDEAREMLSEFSGDEHWAGEDHAENIKLTAFSLDNENVTLFEVVSSNGEVEWEG